VKVNTVEMYSKLPWHQYSETNVVHFLFSLLRIKGLYMFRALLARLQEVLHKRHLLYLLCACYVSWLLPGLVGAAKWQHASSIASGVCLAPSEDEQVMLETCSGFQFTMNWIKRASRRFHCTERFLLFFNTVEPRFTNLIRSWRPFVNRNVRKPKLFFP
jgi:hypothetical protein